MEFPSWELLPLEPCGEGIIFSFIDGEIEATRKILSAQRLSDGYGLCQSKKKKNKKPGGAGNNSSIHSTPVLLEGLQYMTLKVLMSQLKNKMFRH